MNDTSHPSVRPELWRQRYESVRQYAISGTQSLETEPLGWVLLVRHGIVGWMNAWADCETNAPSRHPVSSPAELSQPITKLLVSMSLHQL